jgi:hypothetical protein
MKREDDQELWDLLGKAAAPALSPFFARNVVRQVREETQSRHNLFTWLRPRILVPTAAFALAVAFAGITLQRGVNDPTQDNLTAALGAIDPQDFEVVADLDDLIAMEDDNLWDDDSQSL